MEKSLEVAKYLISINNEKFKDTRLISYNGHDMYAGDFCLQKTIYFANIFYLMIYGVELIDDEKSQVWENGPVYNSIYRKKITDTESNLSLVEKDFLISFNNYFNNLTANDLYILSHQDFSYLKTSEKNAEIDVKVNIKHYLKIYKKILKTFNEKYYVKSL